MEVSIHGERQERRMMTQSICDFCGTSLSEGECFSCTLRKDLDKSTQDAWLIQQVMSTLDAPLCFTCGEPKRPCRKSELARVEALITEMSDPLMQEDFKQSAQMYTDTSGKLCSS